MKNKLLLTGEPGLGKSTLIRNVLLPHLDKVCGFFVQRVLASSGRAGFSFLPLGAAEDYSLNREVEWTEEEGYVFLSRGPEGKWQVHPRAFDDFAREWLARWPAEGRKLILMDEIGGVEVRSPRFFFSLERLLRGEMAVLGVLKSYENIGKMKEQVLDAGERDGIHAAFSRMVAATPRLIVRGINRENYPSVRKEVLDFVNRVVSG